MKCPTCQCEFKAANRFLMNRGKLNEIAMHYPAQKRGGVFVRQRMIAEALWYLASEGDPQPYVTLTATMRAFAQSDQGRSKFCPALPRWIEDGGYLQDPAEWREASHRKPRERTVSQVDLKAKLDRALNAFELAKRDQDEGATEYWSAEINNAQAALMRAQ